MKTIFVFILLILLCNQVASQPSYKIWSVVTSRNINKGDMVIFDIGLSGFGNINKNYLKLTLYSDTTAKIGLQYSGYEPTEILRFEGKDNPNINSLFKNNPPSIIIPADTHRISGEQHFYSIPTTSGDKNIKIIATFSQDSLLWHTEEAYINFHVNTYYEEHQTLFNSVGLFLAFLALIKPSIFTSIFRKIYQLFQKLMWKVFSLKI